MNVDLLADRINEVKQLAGYGILIALFVTAVVVSGLYTIIRICHTVREIRQAQRDIQSTMIAVMETQKVYKSVMERNERALEVITASLSDVQSDLKLIEERRKSKSQNKNRNEANPANTISINADKPKSAEDFQILFYNKLMAEQYNREERIRELENKIRNMQKNED